ncbi:MULTISPECIES: hypothetical protein [Bacillus]|uniref:IDEAL domain-containing protein n=1 Tax=Bacillus sonorensis TaxID=119858 RepID=A0ABN5AJ54_9BACI|nr:MULTISPECIES: hypothetical protein [Bacillus]ASB89328.1 hypothetical protein S101395_02821 [Bacillus sonorensis]MEC0338359.1 hypothetical protein [Bacillus sonorensis]MEC0425216.1 hypothetical protein [Bacillus sonorensis]MEC0460770.1 hypothetical protein [Bacillus sonorensis]MEC0526425.1 hypothetical protein [Bacillus sonorensis]
MRDGERINRIAGLITQIWERQHDKSFLQLIETLKSEYNSQQTILNKETDLNDLNNDEEFEKFLREHLNILMKKEN